MMNYSDIAALFMEPAGEHNGKHKTGCKLPKSGSAASGCAFDGAQIMPLPVTDVAQLLHGNWLAMAAETDLPRVWGDYD